MSWKRPAIGLALLSGAILIAIAAGALSEEQPRYFVDGARPDPMVQGITGEVPDRCVQHSATRPDVMICGPVAEGWQPPPIPYFDTAICNSATDRLSTRESAEVDTRSCLVTENDISMWDVSFRRKDGNGNVHVPFDPSSTVSWAAHP